MTVQTPHDHFFRKSFGRTEIARNYLEEYLPDDLRQALDLSEMVLQEGTYIDEEMQRHQSDLVYQVRLRSDRTAYIYFLFEHKSYPDPQVAFQLLRYMVRFWERQDKEEEGLSPIIPLVIYHGERRWSVPLDFGSLLGVEAALRPYLPDFRYHLSDFSHLSDEEIRGEIWLRVSLSVLRAIFDPQLRAELDDLLTLVFQLLEQRTGVEYIQTILYYLSRATEKVTPQDLQQALLARGATGEKLMTTIAQELKQEGIQEGIQKGIIVNLRDNIVEILAVRLAVPEAQFQARLQAIQNPESLRLLMRRAATVEQVAQFEEVLTTIEESRP